MTDRSVLGLDRRRVELAEHRPEWRALAEHLCGEVMRATGGLIVEVEHVGSTAVEGLVAKPILDIAAGVRDRASATQLEPLLAPLGFAYRGDWGDAGGHLFVRESGPGVRTVHLHVVEHLGSQWEDYLLFRDTLRRDERVRDSYDFLKRSLMQAYPLDREAYTSSKGDFIRSVLGTARTRRVRRDEHHA
ncbi:GrpB family protein [Candidatus Fermentibacterales bacterium]|nr:GrpB family protein [Candidatus Fermentibacterales bacterium]